MADTCPRCGEPRDFDEEHDFAPMAARCLRIERDQLSATLAAERKAHKETRRRLDTTVEGLANAADHAEDMARERDEARATLAARDAELATARADVERLTTALRVAQAALDWGHAEMRGRPPQHWLDAMHTVKGALLSAGAASVRAYVRPDPICLCGRTIPAGEFATHAAWCERMAAARGGAK